MTKKAHKNPCADAKCPQVLCVKERERKVHEHCVTPCDSIRIQDSNHSAYLSLLDMTSELNCPSCGRKFKEKRCGFCEGWMQSWVSPKEDAKVGPALADALLDAMARIDKLRERDGIISVRCDSCGEESTKPAAVAGADVRERLAALCHDQWSGWMDHLFGKLDGSNRIPTWASHRWKTQMTTPYDKLSEEEKDSDRREADKFIALLGIKP